MSGRMSSLPEVDLTCPICCDIFRDPVVLKCSHSFCAACLQQYWSTRGRGRDCPLCRKESNDEPVVSLTLKNVCDAFKQDGEMEAAAAELYCDPVDVCPLHQEKFKLFCLQDREPICIVCHTSRKHKQHACCPLDEAVVDMKSEMKDALTALQEKRETFEKMKKDYEVTEAHIQAQAQFVERRTREEFEELHRFLRAEEEAKVDALKRDKEEKIQAVRERIGEMTRTITSLSESITALQAEMDTQGISVLSNCKRTLARARCPMEDPVMISGALIDVAEYLGSLKYAIWERMQDVVKYTPVTLNPNTAAPWLVISDDLTSVCDSDVRQTLPNNPERYDPDTGILGHRPFSAGKHAWKVEVGGNTAWVLGVAVESVVRKEKVSSVLKNGYFTVYFYHEMYFAGTSPLTRLNLKRKPQRIRVQLECDKRWVGFYDADDDTHIYSFKKIPEEVFPYFWVGCKQFPLKIEPVDVSVKALDYWV